MSITGECKGPSVICSSNRVFYSIDLIRNNLIDQRPPISSGCVSSSIFPLMVTASTGHPPPWAWTDAPLLSLELHGNNLLGTLPPELFGTSKLQLLNVTIQ